MPYPASAGAVGQRPRAQGDEPQPHDRQLSARSSTASAPRGPTSRSPAISSSASPARPRPISRRRCELVDAVNYAQAFSFKYSPRPGTPAAAMDGQVPGRGDGRAAAAAPGAAQRAAARLQPRERRPAHRGAARAAGPQAGPAGRQVALAAVGPSRDRRRDRRPGRGRDRVGRARTASPAPSVSCSRRRRPPDGRRRKPPKPPGPRARLEIEFEQPHLLGPLFGEFDRNLVAIEDRLGVYIAARGTKVQIEGEPEDAARARDVLTRPLQPARPGPGHRRRHGRTRSSPCRASRRSTASSRPTWPSRPR